MCALLLTVSARAVSANVLVERMHEFCWYIRSNLWNRGLDSVCVWRCANVCSSRCLLSRPRVSAREGLSQLLGPRAISDCMTRECYRSRLRQMCIPVRKCALAGSSRRLDSVCGNVVLVEVCKCVLYSWRLG